MRKLHDKAPGYFVIIYATCVSLYLPGSVPGNALAQPSIQLEPVLTGLTSPVYVTNAHDGSNRLFIVEQPGRIKVLQPDASSPTIFLNITSKVLSGGERGLLGLAFHPQFPSTNRFFVNYTRQPDGATVIAEYHVSTTNPNVADTNETILLVIAQPFANHNGGMIEFGPDDYLYIAMGDGGSGNDPGNRAQSANELLGKILRIDIDTPAGLQLYSSPSSNPFFGSIPGRDEVYALGFRNPWRFSFDRGTGNLYVGDVGQSAREEIDIVRLGGNYGWRVYEGSLCTNLDLALCNPNNFIMPITEYITHQGARCAVTGGYVYRGRRVSLPVGSYVFADYCSGEIFLFQNSTMSVLLDTGLNISSFGEDESGEIYVVGLGGTVHRIRAVGQGQTPPESLNGQVDIMRPNSVTCTATRGSTVIQSVTGTITDPEEGRFECPGFPSTPVLSTDIITVALTANATPIPPNQHHVTKNCGDPNAVRPEVRLPCKESVPDNNNGSDLGDIYTFWGTAGQTITIKVDTVDNTGMGSSTLDPIAFLVDPNGVLIAVSDNDTPCTVPQICGFSCPFIHMPLPLDGIYRLIIGDTNNDICTGGPYTVIAQGTTPIPPPTGNGLRGLTLIVDDGSTLVPFP